MRALVAFDKFKDALSARQACAVAAEVLREKHPDWEIDLCPLSDGGDGFEEVLSSATPGTRIPKQVMGPRGSTADAGFTLVSRDRIPKAAAERLQFPADLPADAPVAIIEMAVASGLALLPPAQRNLWETTSRGTGQLLRAATEAGAKWIILGVGGSATHDLGLGALTALGLDFCDNAGAPVRPPTPLRWDQIVRITGQLLSGLPPISVACDVNNPLLGPSGSAALFAPQKGLHPDELPALETASERMAHLLCGFCHKPLTLPGSPGAGAAGGIAFGLLCTAQAKLVPGFALVADWLNLESRISAADLVLTGEGRFDATSLRGKGPGAVIARALSAKKAVSLFAGQIVSPTAHDLLSLHTITPSDTPTERALRETPQLLAAALRKTL